MLLVVVAQNGFRDEEYFQPKELLEFAGYKVKTASGQAEKALGKMGGTAKVDIALSQVKVEDYEAVVFVGGPGAAEYIDDETALNLAREADKKGKIVGAICIAPAILARAGILKGKKATVFPSDRGILIEEKAYYVDTPVVVDGRIITASGPAAAQEFGKALVKALGAAKDI
jgi:protease I